MRLFTSLKFRFVLLFSLFIVALCITTSVLGLRQMIRVASGIFAGQGVFVAETAAAMIDGDAFEKLADSLDGEDPFYEETRVKLAEFKKLTNCLYLYTMAPAEGMNWKFIIDGSAPPDSEDFSALGEEEDTTPYDEAFHRVWATGQTGHGSLEYLDEYGWIVSIYAPIVTSAGVPVGMVGCDFGAEYLYHSIKEHIIRQVGMTLVSIAVGLGLMFLVLRMIFGRLNNINLILKEISTGEGDLTKRIRVRRHDEIGELATHFNLSLDKISNLVVAIKKQAASLFGVGSELASNMEQTAGAAGRITGTIQGVNEKVTRQSASVDGANAALEQVTLNIDKLNRNVEIQTKSVSHSSAAIEEMLASIQGVTQTLIRNGENVEELIRVAEMGRSGLEGISGEIQEIARESEGLLQINGVMQAISGQTNLLSMNAAIEAAHAGEAGRGFAVVAGEIRKLAENAGQQSKSISSVLKKIKTAIDAITVSANAVLEQFQSIGVHVRTVSEQEAHIRGAMEEQDQGSRRILEAVGRLNEITRLVKQSSGEMLGGSRNVMTESENLQRAAGEIARGMGEIAGGAEQINAAMVRVSDICNTNKEHINTLFAEVSKFKVE
ncbi:MAG: methyl-accepting chemotaxis protein [Treponema sp.]|jgi:methyl-accepting chemotaxis protein|nr:methyl-accepting chemotaxis protein [Treponema sp.]